MTTPRHRTTWWPVVRRQELHRYRLRPLRPYSYPKEEAKKVSREAIARALNAHPAIKRVVLVYFSDEDARIAGR